MESCTSHMLAVESTVIPPLNNTPLYKNKQQNHKRHPPTKVMY